MLLDHDEPTNYEEAMMSPDSAKWLEAMKSEMGSVGVKIGGSRVGGSRTGGKGHEVLPRFGPS